MIAEVVIPVSHDHVENYTPEQLLQVFVDVSRCAIFGDELREIQVAMTELKAWLEATEQLWSSQLLAFKAHVELIRERARAGLGASGSGAATCIRCIHT